MTTHRGMVCGECGSPLEERKVDGRWQTVCAHDQGHDASKAMTRAAWQNRPGRRTMQAALDEAVAQEVFSHLPPELQAAIAGKGGPQCQS
jgi:hypothetical protein